VYPLPNDGDVTVNGDGSVTIQNAIYRCAGLRQTFDLPNGLTNPTGTDNPDGGQSYENTSNPIYSWAAQPLANPTLGYVYATAAPDRIPVYAVAIHPTSPELGWRESRPKIYTTDASERQTVIAQGGRDDGIAFYVPSEATATTQTIYHSETADAWSATYTQYTEYYFGSGDLSAHAGDATPPAAAFQVFAAEAPGTQPLMGVLYQPGENHVELAVGQERYNRALNQGQGPLWHLEWSGITQPTTLVVEALATGCPFQGVLSAQHLEAPPHAPFLTLTDVQSKAHAGEVFINGQFDVPGSSWQDIGFSVHTSGLALLQTPNASPVAIARSFVEVSPQPHDPSAWDYYQGFAAGSDLGSTTSIPGCLENGGPGYNCGHWQSSAFDISAYRLDEPSGVMVLAYGVEHGQLWTVFDDSGQDVTGKVRFGALEKATIDADPTKFLHVTWSVTTTGSDRRYPQLLVSDQPLPVQEGLANADNNTLIVQTILGPSMRLEAQAIHGLVHGSAWDVNNQATAHGIIDYDNTVPPYGGPTPWPAESPFEHSGMDRMTRFDAYISSNRVYVLMDGTPAGCTQYPTGTGFALSGPVTVTFGDVLYHEGAETLVCYEARPYAFMYEHQCTETKRVWDDLGFKSGVAAPAWDAVRFPCQPF
jgi:hypothetical protein